MANAARRCAIYTRKSSEEGLEQDYNSLHAQREACEAFISSQAGEGWQLVKTAYDDGGLSGGTMERPALQRLLVDISQGLIDVVVVYKVDRLTRSLTDFAKMVEVFDARGISFVAVTQQFNTHHLDGPADPQRAAVVCTVRARSDRRTNPRQLEESGVDLNRLPSVLKSAHAWSERLASRSEAVAALGELIERVQLSRESLHLSLKLPLAHTEPSDVTNPVNLLLPRLVPMQMKRRGVEMRIVLEGDTTPNRVDLPLLKAVARARRWAGDLVSGKVCSVGELARREGFDGRSVRRLIPLGFLSPRIVEALAAGHQPPELTAKTLTERIQLSLLWSEQEHALGLN